MLVARAAHDADVRAQLPPHWSLRFRFYDDEGRSYSGRISGGVLSLDAETSEAAPEWSDAT